MTLENRLCILEDEYGRVSMSISTNELAILGSRVFWYSWHSKINHNNHRPFVGLETQSHQSQSFGNQSHQSQKKVLVFFNHNENFKLVYLSDLKRSRSKFDGVDF